MDGGNLGGGVEDGLLDGVLGDVERALPQPPPESSQWATPSSSKPIMATWCAQRRLDLVQGLVHPVLDRDGVDPVEREEAAQQIVLGHASVDEVAGRFPGHEGQGPFQAGAVELDEEADQRLGLLVNGRVRFRSKLGRGAPRRGHRLRADPGAMFPPAAVRGTQAGPPALAANGDPGRSRLAF